MGIDWHERFWSRVDLTQPDCWEWTGPRLPLGYGRVHFRSQATYAHRVAWELTRGRTVPKDMCICHTCDNPACCRPDHLFLGTHANNIRDRDQKGRGRWWGRPSRAVEEDR